MKTHFLLFLALLLLNISCSSSNSSDSTTINPGKSIKKYTEIVYDYSGNVTYNIVQDYTYENNLLKYTLDNFNNKNEFVYNNNQIVQMIISQNNVISETYDMQYNGSLLTSMNSSSKKIVFEYINNKLSKKSFYTLVSGNWVLSDTTDYTFDGNNNISDKIFTHYYNGNQTISKQSYAYDNHNNPMKNMNATLQKINDSDISEFNSVNNILTLYNYNIGTTTNPYIKSNNQITYNSDYYPTEIIQFSDSTSNNVYIKTTIEYYN